MVPGFKKMYDMAVTEPDKALAQSSIALTTAAFTVIEWCLVIGAIRYMGEVFDEKFLRWFAQALQGLISACIYFYSSHKLGELLPLPDRHEAPKLFWTLNAISASLIGVIYFALNYVIGNVVDAAAVEG